MTPNVCRFHIHTHLYTHTGCQAHRNTHKIKIQKRKVKVDYFISCLKSSMLPLPKKLCFLYREIRIEAFSLQDFTCLLNAAVLCGFAAVPLFLERLGSLHPAHSPGSENCQRSCLGQGSSSYLGPRQQNLWIVLIPPGAALPPKKPFSEPQRRRPQSLFYYGTLLSSSFSQWL